ncbi:MAG: stage III sporulation protein AD [Firmicutes bacterium]|nr:stage III sporulation protein AD [Bacillota bacterium]
MEIFQIASVGIITAFCVLILKDTKSEISMLVGIAGGIIILLMLIGYLTNIFVVIRDLAERASIPSNILTLIIRIVGVGYIAEFSAGIIEETGSKSLADKITLGGRIMIVVLSLPIILSLFNVISDLLSNV